MNRGYAQSNLPCYSIPIFITINRLIQIMGNVHADCRPKSRVEPRDERRKANFIDAKMRFERYALASGSFCIGRDENGAPAETRAPLSLGITTSGWFVRTVFKRDDASALKGRDWREVEAEAKSGALPTRLVVTENHIVTAVRELKHVREGYLSEIEATESLVSGFTSLNDRLANRSHPVPDDEILSVIAGLRELRPVVGSKDSPLKQIVGLGRLDEAIRRFERVLEPDCRDKAFRLGRACAVLSSVPERLGNWREKRIAGGVAYTAQRECALRAERDRWVFSQFARFSSNPARIHGYIEEDGKRKAALLRIESLLSSLESLHAPLRALRKADRWTEGDEAKLSSASAALEAMKAEAGESPWNDRKGRERLKRAIGTLSKKKNRSADEEVDLAGARKAYETMKSEAMKMPWYDRAVSGPLRTAIRKMRDRKSRTIANAAKLESAEKEFAEKAGEARRCIKANASLFGGPDARKNPTHLSGCYSWIYRNIRLEKMGEARDRLEYLVLFLDSNKPRFILDELSKSPDSYLEPVLAEFRLGVEALEAKDFKAAQGHFSQAALDMRAIAYPQHG